MVTTIPELAVTPRTSGVNLKKLNSKKKKEDSLFLNLRKKKKKKSFTHFVDLFE